MAGITIPLDLAGMKTYAAGVATIAGAILGYFGIVDANLAWVIGFGGVSLTVIFLRMGVKKIETGEIDVTTVLADISAVLAEIKKKEDEAKGA